MTKVRTDYRKKPFNASTGKRKRKRKSKTKISKEWTTDDVDERKESNTGVSWFNQVESGETGEKAKTIIKQKFAIDDYEVELSEDQDGCNNVLNPG